MFCKSVTFNIYTSKTSCEVCIQTCEGVSTQAITTNYSKLCFCTRGCQIKLTAKYKNLTVCKTICLNSCFCSQTFCIDLDKEFPPDESLITLHDENYGFPIENAILNFNSLN